MFEDENSQLCRLCLKSGDCPIDIFDPKGTNGLLVWKIIMEFVGIETSHSDGLPLTICEDCMRKLTEFKSFKKMCLNSRIELLMRQINDGFVESHPTQTDAHDLKPVEVFVNVDVALESSGTLKEESDPLGGEEVEPSALITTLDQGVSREEDSASCPLPTGNAFAFGGVKQEIGDDGTETPAGIIAESPAKRRSSNVTVVSCADVVRGAVDGGGEGVGGYQETVKEEENVNGLLWTGHHSSLSPQQGTSVPVDTHSHLKQRRLRSQTRNENYGPSQRIESTPHSTSGKQYGEKNGKHRQRKGEFRTESKQGIGTRAGGISNGSSVGDEKSEGQHFICDACGKEFRSKDLIERHLKVPCGTELIDCGNYNKKFHTKNEYKGHKSLHCGSYVSRRRVQTGVAVGVSGKSKGKRQIKKIPGTCHICNKTFSQMGNLKVHIKTVHLKEQVFSCEVCGKAFCVKGTLQSHMRIHSGVRPFTCTHCQRGFTTSWNLRIHIRAVHEMEKPHACGECGKTFSHKHHLKTHMLLHTGERPHTCDTCSKTFSQKHTLKSHLLIHTGDKPHTCTVCSKSFRRTDKLKSHMATHAKNVSHP